VDIRHRGHDFTIVGAESAISTAGHVLKKLYETSSDEELSSSAVHLYLQDSQVDHMTQLSEDSAPQISVRTRRGVIRPKGAHQEQYIRDILAYDVVFGIGPAGTGKTYLAVACAVEALEREEVRRLVLVRPAVEAGERLGFLPGDLSQKIDPYLRPMYDALYEMLGFERVNKLIERSVIEVAPLAYMRGRTLNDAFVLLDEAQNTTIEQMKMFLTRMGFGSKAVVTGDVTQVDLPRNTNSGLRHVMNVLKDIEGIRFNYFTSRDVVRHQLVQRIVEAYERADRDSNNRGNTDRSSKTEEE
jgi:phosphate starvation-inducible PhoH-like protein